MPNRRELRSSSLYLGEKSTFSLKLVMQFAKVDSCPNNSDDVSEGNFTIIESLFNSQ